MGSKVINKGSGMLSWVAPIIPSVAMAGVRVGMNVDEFLKLLSICAVDYERSLYKFEMSPVLKLVYSSNNDEELFSFEVHDKDLIKWKLYFDAPDHPGVDPRAFSILIRSGKVFAVKVWNFEQVKQGEIPKNIYKGTLPEGIGLGGSVRELSLRMKLIYDDIEECFYAENDSGFVQINSLGDLQDYPDQVIRAICVFSKNT